jgi:hypothetical protein
MPSKLRLMESDDRGIIDMDNNICHVCDGKKVVVCPACDGTGHTDRESIVNMPIQPHNMSYRASQSKKRRGPSLWGPAYYQGRKFDSPRELANSMKPPLKVEGMRDMIDVFENPEMIDGTTYPRKFRVVIGEKDLVHRRGKFQVFDRP